MGFLFSKVADYYMLKEELDPRYLCWYFAKGSAFLHKFDEGIQRLTEAGLVTHWMKVSKLQFSG